MNTTLPGRACVRRASALLAALVAIVLSMLFAATAPASAKPYPPGKPYPPTAPSTIHNGDCAVSTTTANAGPGSQVTFVGTGFRAGTTVTLSVPSASAALGSARTNSSGSFTATFTWPASVAGSSAVVQASASNDTCSFTLVNHKSTVHGSSSSGLSSTGFKALTATTIALVLIGSGAIFLGLARRKRA